MSEKSDNTNTSRRKVLEGIGAATVVSAGAGTAAAAGGSENNLLDQAIEAEGIQDYEVVDEDSVELSESDDCYRCGECCDECCLIGDWLCSCCKQLYINDCAGYTRCTPSCA